MRSNCIYQLVFDREPRIWPSTAALVMWGMPLEMAKRYQKVRREMTSGLRDRLERSKN